MWLFVSIAWLPIFRLENNEISILDNLYRAHAHTRHGKALKILLGSVDFGAIGDIDLEQMLQAQPLASGDDAVASKKEDVQQLHAYYAIKLVYNLIVLWYKQTQDSESNHVFEKHAAAISLAQEQASEHLRKICSSALQVETLENIYSLLFLELFGESDSKPAFSLVPKAC